MKSIDGVLRMKRNRVIDLTIKKEWGLLKRIKHRWYLFKNRKNIHYHSMFNKGVIKIVDDPKRAILGPTEIKAGPYSVRIMYVVLYPRYFDETGEELYPRYLKEAAE